MRKLLALAALSVSFAAFAGSPNLKDKAKAGNLAVTLETGAGDFTGDLGNQFAIGPQIGVRVGADAWDVVGTELSYETSRNALLDGGGAGIWRHNVSGLAKIGLPLGPAKPYAGAGLGVTYVNANDRGEGLLRNDLHEEIRLALGVDFRAGALTAGVRGTYRALFNEEFAERVAPDGSGGRLSGELSLGGRF